MGTNLPSGDRQTLEFLEAHIAQWNTNQAAIGITSAAITDLSTDVANTRQAFTAVESVRADSKIKTQDFYTKADGIHKKGADIISTIKAFASSSGNAANVYLLAGLTPKDPPQPAPAPEQPTNGSAELGGNGAVIINFDARGATGTVWQIWRQLGTETEYTFIGNADSATKSYVDNTVPAGESNAQYTVQGVRGSVTGPVSFAILVQFGGVSGAQDANAAA
jgi:hypothetical protein